MCADRGPILLQPCPFVPGINQLTLLLFNNGFVSLLVYPITYTTTLVKLGYIPKALVSYKAHDGIAMYEIPSIISYITFVESELVCWSMRHRLCYSISVIAYAIAYEYFSVRLTNSARWHKFWIPIFAAAGALLISHPMTVLVNRQIAQFIGRETIYKEVWSGVKHLMFQPIFGLYSGVIPRFIFIVGPEMAAQLVALFFNGYAKPRMADTQRVLSNDPIASFIQSNLERLELISKFFVKFVVRRLLLPFDIVSVATSVEQTGLRAGREPFMNENIHGWLNRFFDMAKRHQLYRKAKFIGVQFLAASDTFIVV